MADACSAGLSGGPCGEFDPASLGFAALIECRANGPAYNGFALSIRPVWPMAERHFFSSTLPEEYAREGPCEN
ncbi:hypothetical protein [Mesorhizobium sp.]|uniref:hypothetical protein n=1 Tax=Mesorhizobium sp. TaxID=1871066 RepID=UPI000FE47DC5|nr:hypothetical protein [Mesorhizobium sp.]RWP40742.1 MAG: hypothetical protein EOR05_32515 [Mesorhizobium sp.]